MQSLHKQYGITHVEYNVQMHMHKRKVNAEYIVWKQLEF